MITKRKGARSVKEIPADILEQLNKGQIETVNLVEWLAVDQRLLLANLLHSSKRASYLLRAQAAIDALKKATVNTINEAIGTSLYEQATALHDDEFLALMATHTSDVVRCWATYTIGRNQQLKLADILQQIQPFAADPHFGVREISWLAVRPSIAKDLKTAIRLLSGWVKHPDEYVRRFASESTRPRGVWCAHIEALKQDPALALPLLEPLRADPSRYVQDSVGNWLNDACKSQPVFVQELCRRWEEESQAKATAYIIKKALRSLEKDTQ